MACEYCHQYISHNSMCPLYKPPKASRYCSICGEGIFNGEEYIENDYGEYVHLECVDYGRDLAKFLGYEIKEMDDENYQ